MLSRAACAYQRTRWPSRRCIVSCRLMQAVASGPPHPPALQTLACTRAGAARQRGHRVHDPARHAVRVHKGRLRGRRAAGRGRQGGGAAGRRRRPSLHCAGVPAGQPGAQPAPAPARHGAPARLARLLQGGSTRHAAPTLSCHAQVDLLYLHNVAEAQLARLGADAFDAALRRAFVWLEEARQRGQIKACAPAWPCGLHVCAAWHVNARQPRTCALRSVAVRAALESDFLGCGLREGASSKGRVKRVQKWQIACACAHSSRSGVGFDVERQRAGTAWRPGTASGCRPARPATCRSRASWRSPRPPAAPNTASGATALAGDAGGTSARRARTGVPVLSNRKTCHA